MTNSVLFFNSSSKFRPVNFSVNDGSFAVVSSIIERPKNILTTGNLIILTILVFLKWFNTH